MARDPVTLEVLRNAFHSAAEEMGATLVRTAMSPNIKDRRDCSTALYTASGGLVAQAEHIPLHLGLMPTVVKAVLDYYPWNMLEPGDTIIINDPYISGSHLPDICLISPVFAGGKPLGLVANLAHHVDVGGAIPGSMSTQATEIFQEGLRIPPLKICRQGVLQEDLLQLMGHNVRTIREFYGDINAQLAANQIGEKRMQELVSEYGESQISFYMEEIINYTEERFRHALDGLPQGEYSYADYLEGDGINTEQIKIVSTLVLANNKVTVDFSGTSSQALGPVNATLGVTKACVYFALKSTIEPDLPSSEGIARAVEVLAPGGSLVNPYFPAPVAHANINTAQRIADVVFGALAKAVPTQVPAAGTGSMSNFTVGGQKANKEYFSYVETYGGGQGAKWNQDGMDGVHVDMTNTRNTPVEVIEINYPIRVEKYGLIPDSGGAGQYRGGCGLVRVVQVTEDVTVSISTERARFRPWGLAGGNSGRNARCLIKEPGYKEFQEMSGKFTRNVNKGTIIILETAGGGGFGSPVKRLPALVQQDLAEGLVSKAAALYQYGLRIAPPDPGIGSD